MLNWRAQQHGNFGGELVSKTITIVKRIAIGSIILAGVTVFAAPGIAAAETDVLAPEVRATDRLGKVGISLKNPNTVGTFCGAAGFPDDADTTDPEAAVWPKNLVGYDWAREGETKDYKTDGLDAGYYVVTAQCATPDGGTAAAYPTRVRVGEETGSLGPFDFSVALPAAYLFRYLIRFAGCHNAATHRWSLDDVERRGSTGTIGTHHRALCPMPTPTCRWALSCTESRESAKAARKR
ncbi:hypothetical protein [Rhodococcus marinonascens]|uniref:hypothetical protein n=1 Tax=Rhodococcus marinonascens TaxID=38311 RepID=UPI000AE5EC81|nr:hypothetical protein [Rhodococcus marinonascens]